MRGDPYSRLGGRRQQRRRRNVRRALAAVAAVVVLAVVLAGVQLLRAAPSTAVRRIAMAEPTFPRGSWSLPLVRGAETDVMLRGVGTVAASPGAREIPIASVTKVMSALIVLKDHPLRRGDPGPSITITPADVATYRRELAAQDSVVAVRAGERLSERDALEAALVPSADNVIQLLAVWDAGSNAAFVAKMNAQARRLGLVHTHYAGPSGVNPATVSTASDQARLATVALEIPAFASIVSRPQVSLPVAGLQYNVDADLGRNGIVGVKTGWVPQGGASFVFAADTKVGSRAVRLVGSIVGDGAVPAIPDVLAQARRVVRAADAGLLERRVVAAGTPVATLDPGYGSVVTVDTARSASMLGWRGARPVVSVSIVRHLRAPIARGARVGTLSVALGSERVTVPLVTTARLAAPSLGWRLTRT